jgi:hypothetical protein
MLSIIRDGPFRYVHCGATGELIITLCEARSGNCRPTGRFVEFEGEDDPIERTLREWKAIARRRIGNRLITDTDNRN